MNEQIKQIAERLRGLRDVLELTAEDIARDSVFAINEVMCHNSLILAYNLALSIQILQLWQL